MTPKVIGSSAAMVRVELPFPDRSLHPNARVHWAKKAKAVKTARADAAWWARAAGVKPIKADALKVLVVFHPPDDRLRDADGMLSSIKASLDGIADVIGVDDHKWEIAMRRGEKRKHGAVSIEIQEWDSAQ